MWRVLVVAVCLVLSLGAPARAGDPPGYAEAKRAFEALDLENRVQIEILLLAAGYAPVTIDSSFSQELFDAISKLQAGSGRRATGIIGADDVDLLIERSARVLAKWDLKVVTIPGTEVSVFVPSGLDLDRKTILRGWQYQGRKSSLQIQFTHDSLESLRSYYDAAMKWAAGKKKVKLIDEKFYPALFFVVAAEKSIYMDVWGIWRDGGSVVMSFTYDAARNDFFGSQLENLLVASLWAMLPPGTSLSPPDEASLRRLKEQVASPSPDRPDALDQGADPPGYAGAKRAFEALDVESRRQIAILLLAAGYGPLDIEDAFSRRLFNAISKMQAGSGLPATGIIDAGDLDRLIARAAPLLAKWGFRTVTIPGSRLGMFVPFGLGVDVDPTARGWRYGTPDKALQIEYFRAEKSDLGTIYSETLGVINGHKDIRIVARFVSAESFRVSCQVGSRTVDYWGAIDQDGVVVTTFSYDRMANDFFGDRLENLMVASLWSEVAGEADLLPTDASLQRLKDAFSPQARPPALKGPAPVQGPSAVVQTTPQPTADAPSDVGVGTGFFITADGHVLTAAHVVEDCRSVSVAATGSATLYPARVLARDKGSDLALLATDLKASKIARLRIGVRLGEPVAAFGYPLPGLLASSGSFTVGNVTALLGKDDSSRDIQISAPIQSGNSGGPVVDASGNLVGVVSSGLVAVGVASESGASLQNVNFAVRSSVAASFLQRNGIAFQTASLGAALPLTDLADVTRSLSLYVECEGS